MKERGRIHHLDTWCKLSDRHTHFKVQTLSDISHKGFVNNYGPRCVAQRHFRGAVSLLSHPTAVIRNRNIIKTISQTKQLQACNTFNESTKNKRTSVLLRVKDLLTSSPSPGAGW